MFVDTIRSVPKWTPSATDQHTRGESDTVAIRTISPVTGEVLKTFDELTPEQLLPSYPTRVQLCRQRMGVVVNRRLDCQ